VPLKRWLRCGGIDFLPDSCRFDGRRAVIQENPLLRTTETENPCELQETLISANLRRFEQMLEPFAGSVLPVINGRQAVLEQSTQ